MSDVRWQVAGFDSLAPVDLYDLLRLRQDVFVVEQDCVFHEIDGRDPQALHLLGRRDGRLVAYARVFAPGLVGAEASIGRIVTDPSVRGTGLGHALMREALAVVDSLAPGAAVRLAAQHHLEAFYAAYGFAGVGDTYVEDGIVHLDMVRAARATPTAHRPARTTPDR